MVAWSHYSLDLFSLLLVLLHNSHANIEGISLNLFNNREIATAIWLFGFLIFMLSKPTIRKSVLELIKGFLSPKILISLGLMALYTFVVVVILQAINFWNTSHLKDTVFWFCLTGVPLAVSFITSKGSENIFSKIIINNLKVVIIIQFLINFYTFSLVVEMLIVPSVTLIMMLNVVARTDEKHSSVAKLMTGTQIVIGLIFLLFAIFKAAYDNGNFVSIDTFRKFLLVPVLSISFSPFIYLSLVLTSYELLFVRLKLGPEKDSALKRYAKRKLILHFGLSLSRIREFLSTHALDLMRIRSTDDVDKLLASDYSQQ